MSDENQTTGAGGHIEMPDDASTRDDLHEKELAKRGIDTYKELADYYKSLHNEVRVYDYRRETGGLYHAARGEEGEYTPRHNLKSVKDLDTKAELKAEVKKLMSERDDQTARYQELEARYAQELEGLDTYKELADHYKSLYVALHDHEYTGWVKGVNLHDYDHLNTKAELKRALAYLLKEREDEVHLNEHYASEVEGLTYDKLAERYKDLYKDVHKDTPIEHEYNGKDLTKIKQLDTPEELRFATMRLMWERDKQMPLPENHPAPPGGEPNLEPPDAPVPNFEDGMPVESEPFKVKTFWDWHREQREMQNKMQKSEIETPPDSDEQAFAAAGGGETQTPLDLLEDQLHQGGLLGEKDEQEKEAPPVDNPEADASSVEPSQPLPPEVAEGAVTYDPNMDPDRPLEDEQEEHQGINTQEQQSKFEATPEQGVSSTEAQWLVDQDELLKPYEDDPSPIPEDQLLNPYEDDLSSVPEDQLLNPYEDDPVVDPYG